MSRRRAVVGPDIQSDRPSLAQPAIASCGNNPTSSRDLPPSIGHSIHLPSVVETMSHRPSGDTRVPVNPSGVSGRALPDSIVYSYERLGRAGSLPTKTSRLPSGNHRTTRACSGITIVRGSPGPIGMIVQVFGGPDGARVSADWRSGEKR